MDLAQYLASQGLTQTAFLELLNAQRPSGTARVYPAAMSEYVNCIRSPSDNLKFRIRDLTDGCVDGNSWLDREETNLPD